MAMACLRLVTFLPLRPDFSLPCFIAFISRSTSLPADGEYLRPEDFFRAEALLCDAVVFFAEVLLARLLVLLRPLLLFAAVFFALLDFVLAFFALLFLVLAFFVLAFFELVFFELLLRALDFFLVAMEHPPCKSDVPGVRRSCLPGNPGAKTERARTMWDPRPCCAMRRIRPWRAVPPDGRAAR